MPERPNILLIMADQMRADWLGCAGNEWMRTPHLDRFAATGVRYPQATTPCPVCMPVRWSTMTGQYTSTHGCYSNHHPGPRPGHDLPNLLRDAGYTTALIGKNHSFLKAADFDVYQENPPAGPDRAAWQKRLGGDLHPRCPDEAAAGGIEQDPDHLKTLAAERFITSPHERPWFLWLSYLAPHTPYIAPEPYFSMYRDAAIPPPEVEPDGLSEKPFRQRFHQRNDDRLLPTSPAYLARMRRVYSGQVSLIDDEVGQVLGVLSQAGQAENTLVLFCSDHGDYMGDHGMCTKSPALYDCLVRVPLMASWPARLAPAVDERHASLIDLLPTCCDAAGCDVPREVEGQSLLRPGSRTFSYGEYGVPGEPYDDERLEREGLADRPQVNPYQGVLPWEGNPVSLAGRFAMARTDRWKYVYEPGGTDELYDLAADPHELTNLAAARRDVAAALRAELPLSLT